VAGEEGDSREAAPGGQHPAGDEAERLAQIAGELDRVEETLRRLDEGKLPSCEVCGAPIPGDPLGDRCADHRRL